MVPKYLRNPQAVAGLYAEALAQAEAVALRCWQNHVLNPGEDQYKAAYEQAQRQVAALEADRDRVLLALGVLPPGVVPLETAAENGRPTEPADTDHAPGDWDHSFQPAESEEP